MIMIIIIRWQEIPETKEEVIKDDKDYHALKVSHVMIDLIIMNNR